MSAPTRTASPRPRRWLRRRGRQLAALALVAALVYVLRGPLLRTTGSVLVSDDGFAPCTHVVVLGGDRRYEVAARLVADGRAGGVLLVEEAPARTVQLGLRPSPEDVGRRELVRRGVPEARVELIPGGARSTWDAARQLGGWLVAHPDATVLVLADRFGSRHARSVLRRVLAADQFARVRVAALPHREYTEADWWRVKGGGIDFGNGALDLAYLWAAGEGHPPPAPRTPDELEGGGP